MNVSTAVPSVRKAWWIASVAGMASYLDAGAIVTTGIALVLFQEPFGITPGQIGQLSALLTVMIAVGALIGGRLGDKYGRRRVFSVTMVLFALGALLLTLAPGVGILYLGVILIGFAAGADLPVSIAMIAESAPGGKQGKMVAFSHVLWMAGVLVVQLLAIFVGGMGVTGARILYGHLFVLAVVVLILRAFLPESPAWAREQAAVVAGTVDRVALRGLFSARYLGPLVGTGLFYALANIAANTGGQFGTYLYVNVAGASVSTAATIGFIAFTASFLATFALMRVVDTRYRMPVFIVCSVVCVVALAIPLVLGVAVPTLVAYGVLYGIAGIICGEPMYKVWSQELFPTQYRSSAQGITIAFTRVVAAVAALFTPAIIEYGPEVLFYFLIATTVVAALIGIFWVSRVPKVFTGLPVGERTAASLTDSAA
ncbi:inositol transporter-like SP family MFS transporter [Arthrobacter pascens]|uniref:MFS transporter n=1 Tax=Arthrobacter pascens TaxID=1677 RepID=UPI00278CF6CB|nr:MFS transporter [Arthrobacter pascens]MDQ0679665.1 inositol transporter-like SP family MFS transporter [Arthrobacter pascens]